MCRASKATERIPHTPLPRTRQMILVFAFLLLAGTTATAKKWLHVGNPGFSASNLYTSLAIDKNGVPYVGFIDTAHGNKMSVMKYDGTNWVMVGSPGFSINNVILLSVAIDDNGTPYAAYCDDYDYKIVVMKFDGSNWVMVGSPGLSADIWGFDLGLRIPFAIDKNGTPYVGGVSPIPMKGLMATVVKYDGNDWTVVGNAGFSDGDIGYSSLALDNNGVPYMAYEDAANGDKATVMKLNGSTWDPVGTKAFTPREAYIPAINFDKNNALYISYVDRNKTYRATVQKYDGSTWMYVGNAGFSFDIADYLTTAIDTNGTIFAIYRGEYSGKAQAMYYNGTSWVVAGKIDFTDSTANFYSMAVDRKHNIPHVSFTDLNFGGSATVMKFDCPPQPKLNICAALTDTTTGSNVITWNMSQVEFVDSYKIYREDNGTYIHIGSVPGITGSFTDPTATSATRSYKYKLTILDSCERETDIDSVIMHKTMRLVFNYLIDNKASITWNSYEGMGNLVYTVTRSNNGGAFAPVASFGITGSDTTFIDVNPPSGSNRYRIDIALAGACNTGSAVYGKITSNTVTSWKTGISDVAANHILLVPNPADRELKIAAPEAVVKIEVYSLTGKKLVSEKGNGQKEVVIDISSLPTGMYLLRVNDVQNATFIKR